MMLLRALCLQAILPQRMELDVASLEPRFHNLLDQSGKPIQTVRSLRLRSWGIAGGKLWPAASPAVPWSITFCTGCSAS